MKKIRNCFEPSPFSNTMHVLYKTQWPTSRSNVAHSSPQVRCACLKNETIGVVALSVCHCPVTPFPVSFLNFLHCVPPCLSLFECQTVYTKLFSSCVRRTFFNDCSSNWFILLYFTSMPLDRNTLPKKGLRYRTHEDADVDCYCINWYKL